MTPKEAIEEVVNRQAVKMDVTKADLYDTRKRDAVYIKYIAYSILRDYTMLSLRQIGSLCDIFKPRNHATILHALDTMSSLTSIYKHLMEIQKEMKAHYLKLISQDIEYYI